MKQRKKMVAKKLKRRQSFSYHTHSLVAIESVVMAAIAKNQQIIAQNSTQGRAVYFNDIKASRKAEGPKPVGFGQASAKKKDRAEADWYYGGDHDKKCGGRVKGADGHCDKLRRVQQGNPRPPVQGERIRYNLNTKTGAFDFREFFYENELTASLSLASA
jgi:hypothetical protein